MAFPTEGFLEVAIENWGKVGFECSTTQIRSHAPSD